TSDTYNENEGGHSLGSNAIASKNDRSANPEDNDNNISEGNGPSILSQNGQNTFETHNLRSSIDHSKIPYDDEKSDLSPRSNAIASENDRSANHEDDDNNISEGNGPSILSQNGQNTSETYNLRRSSRTSVF
nr:hypothetical protein [Tanacetum cinerariifolium]